MSYSAPPPQDPYGQNQYGQNPYGGGQYGGPPAQIAQPQSLKLAVRLMQAGGVLALLSLLSVFVLRGQLEDQLKDSGLTQSQVDSALAIGMGVGVVFGLLGAALWFWMAYANGKGKKWARIVATVFFGISVLGLLSTLIQEGTVVGKVLQVVQFLIGLGAIIMMYKPESTQYYNQQSARH